MSLSSIREQISVLALQVEDPDLLLQVFHQLAAAFKAEKGAEFWDELSAEQQQALDLALKQVQAGTTLSEDEVQRLSRTWLTE